MTVKSEKSPRCRFPGAARKAGLVLFLILSVSPLRVWGQAGAVTPEVREPEGEQTAEDCVECHMKVSPVLVEMFLASTMGRKGVQNEPIYAEVKKQRAPKEASETRKGFLVRDGRISCVLCHGNDHSTITETSGRVSNAVCGGCHDQIDKEYEKDPGHSLAPPAENWTQALEDPRFAGVPMPVLQLSRDFRYSQQGATEPPYYDFDPEYERSGLALRNGCDSCHTRHSFSVAEARKPEACANCHSGAEGGEYDAYSSSKHGTIYRETGEDWKWQITLPEAYASGEYKTPTCAYCHMLVKDPYGSVRSTHNMTRKSIWRRGLQPLLVDDAKADEKSYLEYITGIRVQSAGKRDEMVLICRNCHSQKFVRRYLDGADQVKYESDLLVLRARSVISKLIAAGTLPSLEGFLAPKPAPQTGQGGQPAPEAQEQEQAPHGPLPAIERLYLEMAREHNVRTNRSAFHQSPRGVYWNGYARVRETLYRIQDLADKAGAR